MKGTRAAVFLLALTSFGRAGDWAFLPVERPELPGEAQESWGRSPIDRFVQARHEEEGVAPPPQASREVLMRRLAIGLTGLPPDYRDVRAFVSTDDPNARERVIDRYLASPQYGERWGRHWLDVVRYADTDGFAIDGVRPTLWRYRDYVVRSFNADKPYDRFLREQLAGDELDDAGPEGLVATGFYRLGPWEADNMIAEVRRQNYLDEITSAVGASFLGLTVGCARCHDHKYDPIPTKDYYRLQAYFAPLQHAEREAAYLDEEVLGAYDRTREAVEAEHQTRRKAVEDFRAELRAELAKKRGEDLEVITDEILAQALKKKEGENLFDEKQRQWLSTLEKAVKEHREVQAYAPKAWTISMPKPDAELPVTRVLLGGDVAQPGEEVSPGVLSAVENGCRQAVDGGPPRRLEVADWLVDPRHPLTARVLVNRLWHYQFGKGIVSTPNDLGKNGAAPSHPELLDYLASELVSRSWRVKPMLRLMLTSQTYAMASHHPEEVALVKRDPGNQWLWRAPLRRLEAEVIRDQILAVSGRLSLEQGGPGFFEALPREMGTKYPFFDWIASPEISRVRRSLYIYQRRNMVMPLMEAFDGADASASCAGRESNVNAAQAFALFNSAFCHVNGRHFAARVRDEAGEYREDQITRVFELALQRRPSAAERVAAAKLLEGSEDEESGLMDLCLGLFNANEFLYLD